MIITTYIRLGQYNKIAETVFVSERCQVSVYPPSSILLFLLSKLVQCGTCKYCTYSICVQLLYCNIEAGGGYFDMTIEKNF